MTRFRLSLAAPATADAGAADISFYWLPDHRSSFITALRPNLGSLGRVPAPNIDLFRIAATVYAADRSSARATSDSDWSRRDFQLEIPVYDPAAWAEVAPDLEDVAGFLTGDRWKLDFNDDSAPPEDVTRKTPTIKRVVLLSGGADSAIGALVSRANLNADEEHALLSHFSAPVLARIQRHVANQVETLVPGPKQEHLRIQFARKKKLQDGTKYPTEFSSRSRSLLFLALGLAVASIDGVPLWIPENGFTSLNPPLGPERRGSLSTRTTHPAFLQGLSRVLVRVGAHSLIENPFVERTKGEMFRRAADLVGNHAAARFLSATNSCAHTGQRAFGVSPSTSCGVCLGCVVRRASFHAAGLVDETEYISSGSDSGLQSWLDSKSVEPAIRSFLARGVRERDLIAMNLPSNWTIRQALELCRRGVAELSCLIA